MKEQLYTIPVNDIFDKPCECPVCAMKLKLENDAVAFAMGPSYMEDDIRLTTDKIGFCTRHMQMMYDFENRLGLALIMDTHMKNMIKEIELLQKKGRKSAGGLFSKKEETSLFSFTDKISHSCYICDRIKDVYERYIATIFYLYEEDSAFVTKFKKSKGFCLEHYGMLFEEAPKYLHGNVLEDFTSDLNRVFLENYKRMEEELPRAMTKVNGILSMDE